MLNGTPMFLPCHITTTYRQVISKTLVITVSVKQFDSLQQLTALRPCSPKDLSLSITSLLVEKLVAQLFIFARRKTDRLALHLCSPQNRSLSSSSLLAERPVTKHHVFACRKTGRSALYLCSPQNRSLSSLSLLAAKPIAQLFILFEEKNNHTA